MFQVSLYLLQLLHDVNSVRISAYRFFNIDYSLIYKVSICENLRTKFNLVNFRFMDRSLHI